MKTTHIQAGCHPQYRGQRAVRDMSLLALFLLLAMLSGMAQTYTVLHTFAGRPDGGVPWARVLRDNAGALYTTTYFGGAFAYGAVLKIDAHGKETALHSFWGGDGLRAWSGLIRDKSGNFYGTTQEGGTPEGNPMWPLCDFGCGTVFKLDGAGKLTMLHAFTGGADGGVPEAGLVRDSSGDLYGVTTAGGTSGCYSGYGACGVVFKIDTNGRETVLHAFSGSDGWSPSGELLRDKQGNLYGAAEYGGNSNGCPDLGCGTIFKVNAKGKLEVLYNFTGGADGAFPQGPLVRDGQGNLYGTAEGGGNLSDCADPTTGCGVVFKLDKHGKETVVYAFQGSPDGGYPMGGVIRDGSGNLFGTTSVGGSGNCRDYPGCGTIFKIDTNGKETVLYSFTGGKDGAEPEDALVMDNAGNLYGTAPYGGDLSCGPDYDPGCGVVFKLAP
jgi:uncharacterized repeat protein (TIGR03803 family)